MCADSEVCEFCENGYLLELLSETGELKIYDFVCRPCDENCLTCIEEADICLSCDEDYTLNGTKCIGRFVVGFVFVFDFSFEDFLELS